MSISPRIPDSKALEDRIRLLEQRNQKLFELATVGLVALDSSTRIIAANRVFLDTLRVHREAALGRLFQDFVAELERQTVADNFACCLKGIEGSDTVFLCRFTQTTDQSEIPLIVHVEVEKSLGGDGNLRLEIADIGASMLSGRKLLENDHDYLEIVSKLPIPVFRRNLQNKFIFANPAYLKHLDRRWEDIKNKSDLDLFPKDLATKYAADDERVLRFGEKIQQIEKHGLREDVQPYWVHVIKTPVFTADGRIVGLQGAFWILKDPRMFATQLHDEFLTDVSKRLQTDVLEKEALYHSLLETIPACIFIKDLSSRFLYVNAAFASLVKKPAEDIQGKTDFDLFPAELATKFIRDDKEVFSTRRKLKRVERNEALRGESMVVEVIKAPLFDSNGEVNGLACIFWDITVAHDVIKFIVHDIKTMVARIEANLLLAERRHADSTALRSITEPLSLLKQVIGKAEGLGLLQPQDTPEPVNLVKVGERLADIVRDPRFSVEQSTSQTVVLANQTEVVSAVLELVENSLRAISKTKDGQVLVHFMEDEAMGTIQVQDNGPGLSEVEPAKTGLGLAFVRYIAKKYSGTFKISNRIAGGTTASFAFPLSRTSTIINNE